MKDYSYKTHIIDGILSLSRVDDKVNEIYSTYKPEDIMSIQVIPVIRPVISVQSINSFPNSVCAITQ